MLKVRPGERRSDKHHHHLYFGKGKQDDSRPSSIVVVIARLTHMIPVAFAAFADGFHCPVVEGQARFLGAIRCCFAGSSSKSSAVKPTQLREYHPSAGIEPCMIRYSQVTANVELKGLVQSRHDETLTMAKMISLPKVGMQIWHQSKNSECYLHEQERRPR